MTLNIKNERVHELARTAAHRTGASQTRVIEEALERYLTELDTAEADVLDGRRAAAHEVVDDMRRRLRAAGSPTLSTEELYDETGLPT